MTFGAIFVIQIFSKLNKNVCETIHGYEGKMSDYGGSDEPL